MTQSTDINLKSISTDISSDIRDIAEKVQNGERLGLNDGVRLFESNDILSIGAMAEFSRLQGLKRRNEQDKANYVYWINNHHLNLTNICEGKCKFCAYRKPENDKDAFLITLDAAEEHIAKNIKKDISEIHIVSALNPKCDLNYYTELLKICKKHLPDVHIQAFTAVEADYIAKISGVTIEDALKALVEAGLGSLPGGGAEIFAEKIREQVCPEKISGDRWLEIMQTAHSLGLKSNATMLTGINESFEDKVDHMLKIRDTQDVTNGFMSFIPLFCHYENTELGFNSIHTGYDIMKTYAISRIMLDNVPHLKAFWIQIGVPMAQLSLSFGVDDIDGTVVEEKITHYAGAQTSQAISKDELISLIKTTGKVPVQRGTLYDIVRVY